jgi:hypothetical protein
VETMNILDQEVFYESFINSFKNDFSLEFPKKITKKEILDKEQKEFQNLVKKLNLSLSE